MNPKTLDTPTGSQSFCGSSLFGGKYFSSVKDSFLLLFAAVLLTVFTAAPAAFAQAPDSEQTKYDKDKTLRGNARVNPSTLGMEFSLPITAFAGRGGNNLGLTLSYSSKVWGTDDHDRGVAGSSRFTNIVGKFSERSKSGWSSSLDVPRLDLPGFNSNTPEEIYDNSGQPWQDSGNSYPLNLTLSSIPRVRVTMPDGSTLELRRDDGVYPHGSEQSPILPYDEVYYGTYLGVDGSKTRLELSWDKQNLHSVLYLPDGSRYVELPSPYGIYNSDSITSTTFIDRHGNQMFYTPGTQEWSDTLGRPIKNPIPNNIEITPTAQTEEYDYPRLVGQSQQTKYKLIWAALSTQQTTQAYTSDISCLGANASTAAPTNSVSPLFTGNEVSGRSRFCNTGTFNPVLLTEIHLPDGTKYKFKYNLYGEIEKIEYPTGGYERFAYSSNTPISSTAKPRYDQTNRGVSDRWVSADGTTGSEVHWSYQIQKETTSTYNGPYHVKTFAPDGTWSEQLLQDRYSKVSVSYGFDDASIGRAYETRVYNNTTSNTLLRRTLTKWTATGALTIGGVTGQNKATRDLRAEKEISIVFEPGSTSALAGMSETVYDTTGSTDEQYFSPLNAKQSKTYKYKVITSLTTAQTADFATIAANFGTNDVASISETDYIYDSDYKARNITGLASEQRVLDPANSNAVTAKTHFDYDESGYGLSSTGSMPTAAANSWLDPVTELGSTLGNKRGLPTTVKNYSNISSSIFVTTHAYYDQYGNVRKAVDGRGNETTTAYSADYAFAYPTSVTTPPPGTGTYGATTGFTSSGTFDYNTGLPLTATDANNQTTTTAYDPYLRPVSVTPPTGGGVVETYYGTPNSSGVLTASERFVRTKAQLDSANWAEGWTWFDGLGRAIKSQKKDADGDVFAVTTYDNMGRISQASNPFQNVTSPSCSTNLKCSTTVYDELGRVKEVSAPLESGQTTPAKVLTAYSLMTTGSQIGTSVTVTDQAGKLRRSITNSLGQLERVDEPDASGNLDSSGATIQPTVYIYDALSNLKTVTQGGQTRSFTYDALSRLKGAANPESGQVNYLYDANGNLTTKTDARHVQTLFAYDALNRVINRGYQMESGYSAPSTYIAAPAVAYYYDGTGLASVPNYSKGKLTKVTSSASATEYKTFDVLGRITSSRQSTAGENYDFLYNYNLSGALISETYPSLRVVKSEYEAGGALSRVTGQLNQNTGAKLYSSAFSYTAAGAVQSMRLGNGRWESTAFNNRLQPTQIGLGTIANDTSLWKVNYEYGELNTSNSTVDITKNNGNVAKQIITAPQTTSGNQVLTQSYVYDSLNRLKSATEVNATTQTWKQTFTYDRFGNRNFDTANTTVPASFANAAQTNPTVSTADNRFSSGQNYSYDAAGNLTADAQGQQFKYDGENKQAQFFANGNTSGTASATYQYDGDGKRVRKTSASEDTIFVYDATGTLAAEYNVTPQSNQTGATKYLTSDTLGSPRVITKADGTVDARRDFLPFGEESTTGRSSVQGYGGDNTRQKFTGYEKDQESGFDFAQARMYDNAHGRFTSPDPIFLTQARISDPQRINLFSYCRNNPLKFVDSTGEDIELKAGMTKQELDSLTDAMFEAYITEGGFDFFEKEAVATTTLTLGVGDLSRFDTPEAMTFGYTQLNPNGDIEITLDSARRDKQEKAATDERSNDKSKGVLGGTGEKTKINSPDSKGKNAKHEVAHGIDARKDPDKYREKKDNEARRKEIQEKRVSDRDKTKVPNKDAAKERFKKLIGYDKYKVKDK